jgi:serpin B
MKKTILLLMAAVCCMAASAEAPQRKMLEQSKTWVYVYHHFEEREDHTDYDHTMWLMNYVLEGDTVIDNRQYMKMYRHDERNWNDKKYYAAFREDEEGRVYVYYKNSNDEFKLIDFSFDYEEVEASQPAILSETIKVNGQLFHRYRYQQTIGGTTYDTESGVEGVGFEGKGLVHYLFEAVPDCICDYEEFSYVYGSGFWFSASDFAAPKEIELTEDERNLVAGNNDFAFNLFRKARDEKSCILSPLSITYALGMLNNGAAGLTQQEINQTLGFGDAGAEAINGFCLKMLTESNTLDWKTKALIANTVFVNEGLGFRLQDGFVKKANDYYDAQPQNRDFGDGKTMDVINQWASDHTEGMIPKVLDEDTFNPAAVSYLLNALYFKGAWTSPFDAAETKDEPFGGGPAVPMMHQEDVKYEYSENDLYQAINLPYGNRAYRMTVYLPREGKTIGDVLETLDGSNWQVNGYSTKIDLKLPRFETENNINLVKIMSDLGMPSAFDPDVAEFPYFCNKDVFIGNMFQVAKIKLDEEGTEAAAVTVIVMETTGIHPFAKFYATRPFLYVISEQSSGIIFFIGQYAGGVSANVISGIANTNLQPNPAADILYDLQGRRLTAKPTKGIYIHNGTKVVVK